MCLVNLHFLLRSEAFDALGNLCGAIARQIPTTLVLISLLHAAHAATAPAELFLCIEKGDEKNCTSVQSRTEPPRVLAFPGAQGFGANATGGRGGRIILVTNTNTSGPGSFKDACVAKGPRLVVFRVGGTIRRNDGSPPLISPLQYFCGSDLTILGQTAPGDGIQLIGGLLLSHNTIVRGLKLRSPDYSETANTKNDRIPAFQFKGSNSIVDHSTVQFASRNAFAVWQAAAKNITASWNIIGPGLRHVEFAGTAFLTGGPDGGSVQDGISVLYNLFVQTNDVRSPLLKFKGRKEAISNVNGTGVLAGFSYSAKHDSGCSDCVPTAQFIGNYSKGGTDYYLLAHLNSGTSSWPAGAKLYASHNSCLARRLNNEEDWKCVRVRDGSASDIRVDREMWNSGAHRYNPFVDNLEGIVLENAGAWKVTNRTQDSGEISANSSYSSNKSGVLRYHPGWPVLRKGNPPTDSDNGGLPDSYENANGLDPKNKADDDDMHSSGYMHVEVWANSLIPCPPQLDCRI